MASGKVQHSTATHASSSTLSSLSMLQGPMAAVTPHGIHLISGHQQLVHNLMCTPTGGQVCGRSSMCVRSLDWCTRNDQLCGHFGVSCLAGVMESCNRPNKLSQLEH